MKMSVDSPEEALEAAVPPVQVNPFGDAQTQDHVVLGPLGHEQVVVLQHVIGLERKREGGGGEENQQYCNSRLLSTKFKCLRTTLLT